MSHKQDSIVDPRDVRIQELLDTIEQQAARIRELEEKFEQLQSLLEAKAQSKAAKQPNFTENYSLGSNKLQNKDKQKSTNNPSGKRPGRKPQSAKRDRATEQVDVYRHGVDRNKCILHRSQYAWRIPGGKAIYVRYDIYDLPDSRDLPLPEGLRNSRSEFGVDGGDR